MTLMSLIAIEHVAVEGCAPGRGLMPDVAVTYSREVFEAAEDPYVESVAKILYVE